MCDEGARRKSRVVFAWALQKNLRFDGLRHDRAPKACINAGTLSKRYLI
jgi:hypothetical protein